LDSRFIFASSFLIYDLKSAFSASSSVSFADLRTFSVRDFINSCDCKSDGEAVLNKEAVELVGEDFVHRVNAGGLAMLAKKQESEVGTPLLEDWEGLKEDCSNIKSDRLVSGSTAGDSL